MVVMNDMDRFHLVMDVIDRVPGLNRTAAWLRQEMVDTRTRHRAWTREHGEDLPEVTGWAWPHGKAAAAPRTGARNRGGKAISVPRQP
jgi:xylulose-5-phosphate/fructose-6-phosphate phosphoketolase